MIGEEIEEMEGDCPWVRGDTGFTIDAEEMSTLRKTPSLTFPRHVDGLSADISVARSDWDFICDMFRASHIASLKEGWRGLGGRLLNGGLLGERG